MANLILLLLSALLALFCGVQAEDQIRLYQFAGDDCDGNPQLGNMDLKLGGCVNINARSFKPRLDTKRKDWFDDVNNGVHECQMVVYGTPNCHDKDAVDTIPIPARIDRCVTHSSPYTIRSAKFICGQLVHIGDPETTTMTKVMTSYSIGNNEKPTEYHTTATFTVTAAASTVTLRSPVAHRLEPRRKKGDVIYKWMFHPWSRSVLCYECYTNKPGNWDWVKCNSGPDHNEACSERPVDADGFPYTTTATETSSRLRFTRTTYTTDATGVVTTATYTTLTAPPTLEARSWHKSVHFRHPWTGNRVCADAEWERRGRPNFEIRLQDIHRDDGNDCNDAESLDVPGRLVETVTVTTTSTQTITDVAYTAFITVTETYRILASTTTFSPINSVLVSQTPISGISLIPTGEKSDGGETAAVPTHTDL